MSSFLKLPNQLISKTGIKMIVYGGAGTGKTRNCAITSPKPVLVAVENGLLSIQKEQIPIVDCRGENCLQNFESFVQWAKSAEAKQFDTIIIDSWSELATQLLRVEIAKAKDGRQAYGIMADKMMNWAYQLVNQIPHNVIFICKQECGSNNGQPYHQPSLEGKKLYTEFTHLIDVILRFQSKRFVINNKAQEYMVASTKNQPDYIARDRSGTLFDDEPQDIGAIINKIRGIAPQQPQS